MYVCAIVVAVYPQLGVTAGTNGVARRVRKKADAMVDAIHVGAAVQENRFARGRVHRCVCIARKWHHCVCACNK